MKQWIIAIAAMATTGSVFADVPGKPKNHPSKVSLQNISSLSGYTVYWQTEHEEKVVVKADTGFIIPGSAGGPISAECWAVNKKTGATTDTIRFSNYYDPDHVVLFNGIKADNLLRYDISDLSNENEVVETKNKDSIANKQLVIDAEQMTQNHTLRNVLLGGAAGLAVGGIAWFVIRRRKKKAADTTITTQA